PASVFTFHGCSLMAGLFLAGALLGVLREVVGTIFLPAGVMIGWLYVESVVRKIHLGVFIPHSAWAPWVRPEGVDFREGPACWMLLAAALSYFGWRLRRSGVRTPVLDDGYARTLKRYVPFSSMCLLAPVDLWLRCLWDSRFAVGWR